MIDRFLSFILDKDLIISVVGAFTGFGLALILEKLMSNHSKRKSIKNLKIELIDIKELLELEKDNTRMSFSYAIYIPIWEAVIGNGDILQLRKKKYYEVLIAVYSRIYKLAKKEDWFFENRYNINKEQRNEEMIRIIKLRNEIFEKLCEMNIDDIK